MNKIRQILIEIPWHFDQAELLIEHINRLLYVFGLEAEPDDITSGDFISELEQEILRGLYSGKSE